MYISLDLETTGFDPHDDKIIEVGAIKFNEDGKIIDKFESLIYTTKEIPEFISHITGIFNKDLINAPTIEKVSADLEKFLENHPIVGHNINFDTTFLKANNIKITNPEFDTLTLTSTIYRDLRSYSLEALTKVFKIDHKNSHRAMDDAIASMNLFLIVKNQFELLEKETLNKILEISKKSDSPLTKFYSEIKSKKIKKIKALPKIDNKNNIKISLPEKLFDEGISLFETQTDYIQVVKELEKRENTQISISKILFDQVVKTKSKDVDAMDTYTNYLDENRYKEYLSKQNFETTEAHSLIKIIIWKEFTKSNLLSELSLFGEEKKITNKINKLFEDKDKIKTTKATTICSHEYLTNNPPIHKNLCIIDIESFSNYLKKQNSIYINIDKTLSPIETLIGRHPEIKYINEIKNKTIILFGLIGLSITNSQKLDSDHTKLTIDYTKQTEWKNIINCLNNLILLSHDLKELGVEKNNPELKTWKENLTNLAKIIKTPDFETQYISIKKDYNENPILTANYYSLENESHKIFNNYKNIVFIDNAISNDDEGEYIKKLYYIPKTAKYFKDTQKLNINLSFNEHSLTQIIEASKGNTAIIINSRQLIKLLTLKLTEKFKNKSIISQAQGSLGKMTELFKDISEDKILILSTNAWLNFEYPKSIQNLIIPKIPFTPLNDINLNIDSKKFLKPFIELQIPKAILKIVKLINHAITRDYPINIFILDKRLLQKQYSKQIITTLKKIFNY